MCKIMNVFGQNGRENLWMFFQAVIAVYLLILSVIDIRWKKVSVRSLLILLAIAVLCQVLCSKGELRMMVAGGLCGGVFLFFSCGLFCYIWFLFVVLFVFCRPCDYFFLCFFY